MGKYNVGDKVRMVSERGACWNRSGEMDKYRGTVMTIRTAGIFGFDDLYQMEEDRKENFGCGWMWSVEDIVGLVDEVTDVTEVKTETHEYKVGDRVIIEESNVEFLTEFAGVEGVIDRVNYESATGYQYHVQSAKNPYGVWCKVKCLASEKDENKEGKGEQKTEKIVITHDGKTTTATLYRVDGTTETATARCAPEDTFDFKVGAELAMERLMEKITPKWKFETGDYAKVISCNKSCHGIKLGTVVKLERDNEDDGCGWYKVYDDSPMGFWYVREEELEAYTPKNWTGRAVCVSVDDCYDTNAFTVGKIYKVDEGKLIDNHGDYRPLCADSVTKPEDLTANEGYFHDWAFHFIPIEE